MQILLPALSAGGKTVMSKDWLSEGSKFVPQSVKFFIFSNFGAVTFDFNSRKAK